METTPGSVADVLLAALVAQGAKVTYRNATDRGRDGFAYVTMPDGVEITVRVEIN